MAIVLVKSYHWIKGKKCAQLTCWNCHKAMGVLPMSELQAMTCTPGLPVVCFSCNEEREDVLNTPQLELWEVLERAPFNAKGYE